MEAGYKHIYYSRALVLNLDYVSDNMTMDIKSENTVLRDYSGCLVVRTGCFSLGATAFSHWSGNYDPTSLATQQYNFKAGGRAFILSF